MNRVGDWVQEPAQSVRVAAQSDVVVVGGGPAGQAAAVAAARNGASVTLLERYNHLGGLASGGMVLVLDDMWDRHQNEISVRGICLEMIERMKALGLAEYPLQHEWGTLPESVRRWKRWGTTDFHSKQKPSPICFAAAFDPDAWKRTSLEMVMRAGIQLRLHSWFSRAIVEDGVVKGVICETKSGREAILGKVVIDATGDLDVAASAGAPHISGSYIATTVFRLGGVDTREAERFEFEEPEAYRALDKEVKQLLGGAWESWWLRTPLPGVVWCNCPHMAGLDGLKVEDLTQAEIQGRTTIHNVIEFVRAKLPGFRNCYLVDMAPQTGIRQTRLLEGEYVMTKEDLQERTRFHDAVARGRDYYYPYRSFVPLGVENLLVAGRHYSATSAAQKTSREIPPCMAMGEAVGIAATLALDAGVSVRRVDVARLQRTLRAQGADPGDQPGPNPDVPAIARPFMEAVA
ncbi:MULTISPECIES: FAD-dependent oxidoreductase [Ramlibacter]|uniref:FAD-dependent oxidoreductase n=1 Tax=Ramlibacter pinisoli TaxID=2682844 RepID=A0A6N8IZU5_9BURK|nr:MULTISPECIES: FAD-dependent oxidoreductase [Ramlibacter]MBA2962617.1 FAD-dependent oxidoreductase [Ramlibacter sp. CGMCC 1.13660]MVQ32559.1 FAD-dependent oxidoreductase [Ramlibacter pinisoli]